MRPQRRLVAFLGYHDINATKGVLHRNFTIAVQIRLYGKSLKMSGFSPKRNIE